jgi:hypothetical protein
MDHISIIYNDTLFSFSVIQTFIETLQAVGDNGHIVHDLKSKSSSNKSRMFKDTTYAPGIKLCSIIAQNMKES